MSHLRMAVWEQFISSEICLRLRPFFPQFNRAAFVRLAVAAVFCLVAELPGLEGSLPVAHRIDVHTRHPGNLCIADTQGKKEARDLPFMLGMLRQSRVHGSLRTYNFSCWIPLTIMWETIVQKRLRLSGFSTKNQCIAFVYRAHCG